MVTGSDEIGVAMVRHREDFLNTLILTTGVEAEDLLCSSARKMIEGWVDDGGAWQVTAGQI